MKITEWERYDGEGGFEDAEAVPRLLAIWEKYVSETPRPGYRPLGLSYSPQGTYNGEEFLDAEQITKNKFYIYTREINTGFTPPTSSMKRVGEGWEDPTRCRSGWMAGSARDCEAAEENAGEMRMEQKVIYNGQILTLTYVWATGKTCLWITDSSRSGCQKWSL